MIRAVGDRGLTPVVTLNHLTLPLWVLTPPIEFTKKLGQHILPSPLKDLPLADPPSNDPYTGLSWITMNGLKAIDLKQNLDYFMLIIE